MQWLHDGPTDQCAHGEVELTIDSLALVTPETSSDVTVSAAGCSCFARSSHDHTAAHSVTDGSQLFPCCGHSVFAVDGPFEALVLGCDNGVDLDIVHGTGTVTVRTNEGLEATVKSAEWRDVVLCFVDAVEAFYDASPPRQPFGESPDDEGWAAFWHEWRSRKASGTTPGFP